ncbi:MAG: MerR family transcriptional regulator [Candidatus Latescibacterota bacterium]|jgi:DNA-binding transcriptional MerR regulator
MADEYTLDDLAKMLRINPRTIRSYIQQGLLRGPDSLGRNARYSEYHLKRLRVIRTLKEDHNLPLSEIRRLVTMAGPDEEIEIQLVPLGEAPTELPAAPPKIGAPPETDSSSALDYIRARKSLTQRGQEQGEQTVPQRLKKREEPSSSPLEKLIQTLRDQGALSNIKRKTRGEEWVRLEVTPDIEIHVRGQLRREQLRDFEQLADLMRHILLGSEENE